MKMNRDGKHIKLVLGWLTNRELTDGDLAQALKVDKAYYSRHKDDADYPSFEDLNVFGRAFEVSPRVLQISFGFRDLDELILLDKEEMRQYLEIGGANWTNPDDDALQEIHAVGRGADVAPFSRRGTCVRTGTTTASEPPGDLLDDLDDRWQKRASNS